MSKPTKIARILTAFIDGQELHRFNAFSLRETCLHSTVSSLHNGYGITILRKPITVIRQGDKVPVMLYWLDPEAKQKAELVLGQMLRMG